MMKNILASTAVSSMLAMAAHAQTGTGAAADEQAPAQSETVPAEVMPVATESAEVPAATPETDAAEDPVAEASLSRVMKFTREDAKWVHHTGKLWFGDVFAEEQGQALDVTFVRWTAGEEAPFPEPLPYEEVLVILSGSYSVRTQNGEITASAGEVIYLPEGTAGTYHSDTDAELIAVTSPPYRKALRRAGRGHELEEPAP